MLQPIPSPPPAAGRCNRVSHFPLGIAIHRNSVLISFLFFFFFKLLCLLRFQSSALTRTLRGLPIVETSFTTASPEWVSVPKSFDSLFVFIFCSTSFQRDWFAFLGIRGPPPVFGSCFVEIAPQVDELLMYLWGRKWSPSPVPPPSGDASPTAALLTAALHSFVGMFHNLFNQSPVVGICIYIQKHY